MVPSIPETGDASVPSPHNPAPAPTGYESFMEPPATPDTSPLHPFPRLPVTQGRGTFRRTLLLPAQPDITDAQMPGDAMVTTGARSSGPCRGMAHKSVAPDAMVTTGARSSGLLARY